MSEPKLQDGYYWHVEDNGTDPIIVEVFNRSDGEIEIAMDNRQFTPTGRLVGPLVPPEGQEIAYVQETDFQTNPISKLQAMLGPNPRTASGDLIKDGTPIEQPESPMKYGGGVEIEAYGITSRAQAERLVKWMVLQTDARTLALIDRLEKVIKDGVEEQDRCPFCWAALCLDPKHHTDCSGTAALAAIKAWREGK